MANNLNAVMPSIYAALHVVSREMIGAIPAVQRSTAMTRAAVGQTVNVPFVPAAITGNITPGSIPPNDGDVTPDTVPVAITKSKYSPVRWSGEEQLAIGPTGQYNEILAQQFAQAMRALANEAEGDIVLEAARNASRAYGTPGTAPFGVADDLSDFAGLNQILDDNGAPMQGRRLIINSNARFNLEAKQKILLKVNESGGDDFLRRRVLADVLGFGIGVTQFKDLMIPGTGADYVVNGAQAKGDIAVEVDGGAGTVLEGAVVTFAGDSNKYVSSGLTGGVLGLNRPGLVNSVADNVAATIGAAYRPNVAFTPDALVLATRAPAAPAGGDSADDFTIVQDEVSGVAFEVRMYREYRRVKFEVGLAWGTGAINSAHIALLLG